MDAATGATLDAASVRGSGRTGGAGERWRQPQPPGPHGRERVAGDCVWSVWGDYYLTGVVGEYRRASDIATGGGVPSRSKPRSAAVLKAAQGRT